MNSCVLMAEIVQPPQLRYTSDNQTAIAEFLVQFEGLRPDDPAATLKVIGWGNLAQQIQEQYHQGDRVVIEGRLGMNMVERPEGFKEKKAELTVQRIHRVSLSDSIGEEVSAPSAPQPPVPSSSTPQPTSTANPPLSPQNSEPDYDDIPF